jgi:hypothetical protein
MLVANALAGRREHGRGERRAAKDAAEAYRYGYLLAYDLEEVANRVEGAMAYGGCRPVEGRRRRPPASFPFRSRR